MRKLLYVLGGVAVLLLLAAGYYVYAPRRTPAGQPSLTALDAGNLADFQRQFNDAADRARLLLLLSPT